MLKNIFITIVDYIYPGYRISKTEDILRAALLNAKDKHYQIVSDVWYAENNELKCCCAIGALHIDQNLTYNFIGSSSKHNHLFGNSNNFWKFIRGFSNDRCHSKNDWFALGIKLNKEFSPISYFEFRTSQDKLKSL